MQWRNISRCAAASQREWLKESPRYYENNYPIIFFTVADVSPTTTEIIRFAGIIPDIGLSSGLFTFALSFLKSNITIHVAINS